MTDPYSVLGIQPDASDDEVKRAYRDLSRKYHPDSYNDNPLAELAEEKFKEVQDAYRQIMDMREGRAGSYGQNAYNQGNYQGGYNQGSYQGNGSQGYNNRRYDDYGRNYGRGPQNTGDDCSGCGTGNMCCDLWCLDTMCECMGGDLCSCF